MGLTDSDVYVEGVTDNEVVVPLPTTSAPHPLLRSSGTHDHGPMLEFVVPQRNVSDADAITSLDHAYASPDRDLGSRLLLRSTSV